MLRKYKNDLPIIIEHVQTINQCEQFAIDTISKAIVYICHLLLLWTPTAANASNNNLWMHLKQKNLKLDRIMKKREEKKSFVNNLKKRNECHEVFVFKVSLKVKWMKKKTLKKQKIFIFLWQNSHSTPRHS